MPFKVGQQGFVSIANLKKKSKEAELKKYDVNGDNLLNKTEAAKYFTDKTGKTMTSLEDVYKLAGGKQREMKVVDRGYPVSWAPDWKGDFNIPGFGAGNVRTSRGTDYVAGSEKPVATYNFLIDCNLMDRAFLENNVKEAHIVIAQKDFKKESGSKIEEQNTIPLSVQTREGYTSFDRGGGSHWVPEEKYLCATATVDSLKKLMSTSGGLSFYVRLETNDGRTLYINKDGKPAQNFQIAKNELATK